jgi:hypothetical protein
MGTTDKDASNAMQHRMNDLLEKCKLAKEENQKLILELQHEKNHFLNLEQARKK